MSVLYDDLPPFYKDMERVWDGEVRDTAMAQDQWVRVFIPGFKDPDDPKAPELLWGPCPWMPRFYIWPTDITPATNVDSSGDTEPEFIITTFMYPIYPARGDPCLIIFDSDKLPWIVAWYPLNITPEGRRG